ncbi:MAG: DnaJ domain-containing protein [Chloroflexi bacterium]|nr:DnaJ domain-containing protein [Chloroflexota bacterium]
MAFDGDPYRTLGLARGATLAEVKRAYRRLVKANHPDAVGSGGLARFLAIQSAYEQLVEGAGGPAGRPLPANAPRRPSAPDPDRADATRRAYGGRPRARRPAEEPEGRDASPPGAEPGRRRGKATLGSTSYDDANPAATEPDWSGASWYGTTSGTYWTINPREYADPRKHGPEYQARARRATGARPEPDAPRERPSGPIHEPASWWTSTGGPSEPAAGAEDDPAARQQAGEPPPARDEPPPARDEPLPGRDGPPPDPGRALAELARFLADPRVGGPRARIVRAFAGWLPIALGIGWALGEVTGCGRFAATCDPSVGPLILLLQGVVLVGLLLSPLLASLAASAAVGLLVAAAVATLVLSATGTAADEGSRRATLGLLLVLAWLAGLAIAIAQRVRAAPPRVGPVS